jgi:hypothetical protein
MFCYFFGFLRFLICRVLFFAECPKKVLGKKSLPIKCLSSVKKTLSSVKWSLSDVLDIHKEREFGGDGTQPYIKENVNKRPPHTLA